MRSCRQGHPRLQKISRHHMRMISQLVMALSGGNAGDSATTAPTAGSRSSSGSMAATNAPPNMLGGNKSGWKRQRSQTQLGVSQGRRKQHALRPSSKEFVCYSGNIRGFNQAKFEALLEATKNNEPDAIVLSETNLSFVHTYFWQNKQQQKPGRC